ncbi:hypothetical protein ATANTOWER_014147 [Ataeniobius toweri]|uniref:Uncharacterized protein n=1 Tax=Ataeniobius toweri TaxID=208326 RepID=A0ABU7BJQ7_9TELE|nr:hypothetical protein [Ataeniobius toweri]
MLLNDPAAVHTFITIMATSYMKPMSNGLDFISLTSHRETEDGPSFLLFTCVRSVLTTKQMPVSEILYMQAALDPVCIPPPCLCIWEVCSVCVYMNVPQFAPLYPHSAAVPRRTLVK